MIFRPTGNNIETPSNFRCNIHAVIGVGRSTKLHPEMQLMQI